MGLERFITGITVNNRGITVKKGGLHRDYPRVELNLP